MFVKPEDFELRDDFNIRFVGDQNQIDANTFVNYLLHFNTIIQQVNNELAPERRISVKIKALEKGSFLVHIELQSILEQVVAIFNEKNVSYLANIFSVYTGLIALKQLLVKSNSVTIEKSGDKKEDTVTINGPSGETVTITNLTYNIYNSNMAVSQALTKQFETLEQDENIEKVEVRDSKNNTIVEVKRDSFDELAIPAVFIDDASQQKEIRNHAILSIIKFSFDPRLKSDFYYHGTKITGYIKDKDFYDNVDSGESFSKGDALEVTLQINKAFDKSVNTDVIKGYEILKVIRHIPRNDPNQLTISVRNN